MKKPLALFTASTTLVVAILFGGIQQQDDMQLNSAEFMQKKLDHSRDIVSGLATENYQLIAKNAQGLMSLSHDAEWQVITTLDYVKLSSEFRSSAERLRNSANEKRLDGATLAYFEVTLNCMRCHKYIRENGQP